MPSFLFQVAGVMRRISRAWPGALRALGFVRLLSTHAGLGQARGGWRV